MAKKRKTLPKNFERLLKNADIQWLINVFDKWELMHEGELAINFNHTL